MTARTDQPRSARARSIIIAAFIAASAIGAVSTASTTGASGSGTTSTSPDDDDDDSTTSSDASTTSDATTTTDDDDEDTTTSTDATTSPTPAGTAPPAATDAPAPTSFDEILAIECEGDTGQPLLADALGDAIGDDGSQRIIEILETCDVEFLGEIDPERGRPDTNVEQLIRDPANDVTPNQTQLDLLDAELAIYWRIAEAWAQSQLATATTLDEETTSTTVG